MTQGETLSPQGSAWLGWDGRQLRWRVDAANVNCTEMELRIDGVVFERIPLAAGTFERDFAFSPSGCAEMEILLHATGGAAIAPTWRVRYGCAASVGADQWSGLSQPMRPLIDVPLPSPAEWAKARAVAIVVPIYDSPQWVQRCIAAVLRWTQGPARLILIDDASSDPDIVPLLAQYSGRQRITVRRNPHNLGYTRTTNLGIELAGGADVVLLNSDTEVGPRWLDRLRLTAYADAGIGTVTAVSDNAGAFSVPELEQYCPIPPRWSLPQAQRALLQHTGGCLPELPTGNGFCLFVKRAMLDRVGALDDEAFPSGYGEENDLCQRAERAGFRHVIAGDVLVRHARSASFGEARRATLGAQGMAVLRARYPGYEAKVGATLYSFARRALDYRVRRIYADSDATSPPRPRVLLACAEANLHGAEVLAAILQAQYECFVLHDDRACLRLYRYGGSLELEDEAAPAIATEDCLRVWLVRYAIELAHVLVADGQGAPLHRAAASVGVPVADSPADADFQASRRSISVENEQSVAAAQHLATYCTHLYLACWRNSASFAGDAEHMAME
jgi:GT2 family glycosyltransferase